MQQNFRRKLVAKKLIGAAWANDTYYGKDNPAQTFIQLGVYHEGDGVCDRSFAVLEADHKSGKIKFTISKSILEKFGITLNIED